RLLVVSQNSVATPVQANPPVLPGRPDPTSGAKGAHCATSARSVKHDWQSASRAGAKSGVFSARGPRDHRLVCPSSPREAAAHVSAATSAKAGRSATSVALLQQASGVTGTRRARGAGTSHASNIYQPLIATVCLWAGCRFIAAEIARTVARGENRTEAARTLFLMP